MADLVQSPPRSQSAPLQSLRKPGLLILVVIVIAIALIFRMNWQATQTRALSQMSTSDLRLSVRDFPKNADYRVALAERYLWEERNEDAMREAKQAIELDSHNSRAYYLLGKSYQRASQAELGLKALERAVELDPKNTQARFLLGHGYYWNDKPLLAVKQLEEYVAQQPVDDVGFRFLGLAQLRLAKLDAAEPALRRAVELGPESSGNHQSLGNFYLNRAKETDIDKAATELLKAVDLNPGADSNRLQAAVALQRANRLPEAANQFEIVFAKSPTDERVCYALLQIYTRLKDENHLARYRELYNKIVKARNANSAITESTPGGASYPTR